MSRISRLIAVAETVGSALGSQCVGVRWGQVLQPSKYIIARPDPVAWIEFRRVMNTNSVSKEMKMH